MKAHAKRFVLAPDSFKESMSASVAVAAMKRGVLAVFADAECIEVPMADGGEGTVEALVEALEGQRVVADVHDSHGRLVRASYGWVREKKLAIIEIAAAAGFDQVAKPDRNPRVTSTFGVGEIILQALNRGARHFVVGIGSSATNDGGAGMLQALGARLIDSQGDDVQLGGAALSQLDRIDLTALDPRLAKSDFKIASDVTNPLLGPNGASAIFGPQKGADEATVVELEIALSTWARVVYSTTGRDVALVPGSGAGGGLGAAFLAFFDSQMLRGVEVVMSANHFAERISGASYVLTGEGSVDAQTASGKTLLGVAEIAARHGVPVIAFAGRIGAGAEALYPLGFAALVPIMQDISDLQQALADGPVNLERAVTTTCRLLAQCR